MTSPDTSQNVEPPPVELLTFVGLLVKAAEEGSQRLAELYLQMAEQSGLDRQQVLEWALRRRPGNPLLEALRT